MHQPEYFKEECQAELVEAGFTATNTGFDKLSLTAFFKRLHYHKLMNLYFCNGCLYGQPFVY